jgi:beta-lactamase superfamily II metal-dependent hydrolase
MKKVVRSILALVLAMTLVLAMCGCSAIFDPDAIANDLKDKTNQAVNNAKDKLEQAVDDAIQDAADAAKDKVDQWLDSGAPTNGTTTNISDSKISVTMLDVGQGLSILIESNGKYMLYDGGDKGTSSYVVSYLEQHGVDHLDYMVASHYDADHLNGLVGVLKNTTVDTIINPDYEASTKVYKSYKEERDSCGAEVIYPSVGDTYTLGYSTITVLGPAKDYGDPNEMSVALKVQCNDFVCIVTGDAENASEADMMKSGIDLDADLYIVGHHGSSSSNTDAFIKAMSPEYAFISCGEDNDYGHPSAQTLDTLQKYNVKIYRSDVDGAVTCESDGSKFAFSK